DADADAVARVVVHARGIQLAAIAVLDVVGDDVTLAARVVDDAAVALGPRLRLAGIGRVAADRGTGGRARGRRRGAAVALAERVADDAADDGPEDGVAGAVVRRGLRLGHLLFVAFLARRRARRRTGVVVDRIDAQHVGPAVVDRFRRSGAIFGRSTTV